MLLTCKLNWSLTVFILFHSLGGRPKPVWWVETLQKNLCVCGFVCFWFCFTFCFTKCRKKRVDKVWSNFFAVNDSCQILLASSLQTLFSHCNSTSLGFPNFFSFFFVENEWNWWLKKLKQTVHPVMLNSAVVVAKSLIPQAVYHLPACACF